MDSTEDADRDQPPRASREVVRDLASMRGEHAEREEGAEEETREQRRRGARVVVQRRVAVIRVHRRCRCRG